METQIREDFPQSHFLTTLKLPDMNRETLLKLYAFLEKTADSNEATTFNATEDPMVEDLISLVKAQGKTSIAEDFEMPFVHPMITIQKWVEELKLIVRESLAQVADT
jgi:hypothetical protein